MKSFLSLISLLVLGINSQQEKPWLVKLMKGDNHVCNGVLASKEHVITTAQCKEGNIEDWKAVDLKGDSFQLSSWTNHPEFAAATRDFDVAVWTLNKPLNLTSYVSIAKGDCRFIDIVPLEVFSFSSNEIKSKDIQPHHQDCTKTRTEPKNQLRFNEFESCEEKPGSPIFVKMHSSKLLGLISDCHRSAFYITDNIENEFFQEFFATPPPAIPSEGYKIITKYATPIFQ